MTADRDFKRVVRNRMAQTGESYTAALAAVTAETVARVEELITRFREAPGDRIDREAYAVEAGNLLSGLDPIAVDPAALRRFWWFTPREARLRLLDGVVARRDLTPDVEAWARYERLVELSLDARDDHAKVRAAVDEQVLHDRWVRANRPRSEWGYWLGNPSITNLWAHVGRDDDLEALMLSRLDELENHTEARGDRLYIARDLMWRAYQRGRDEVGDEAAARMRRYLGEEPPLAHDEAVVWENTLRQTPLAARRHQDLDALRADAEAYADWIRRLEPPASGWLGELAALCMFNGLYSEGAGYAREAIAQGAAEENPYIHMWHAGCHLHVTGNVEETAEIVRTARRNISEDEVKQLLRDEPAFADHAGDERLLEAAEPRGRAR